MHIEHFHDPVTSTLSYLVLDAGSGHCALIDTVLDFDARSGKTDTASADRLVARVRELDAQVQWLLETHVHADHLSGASHLKCAVGGLVGIGANVREVQATFKRLFNAGNEFEADGSAFDRLFADNDSFRLGALSVRVLHTPGHTPACAAYLFEDGDDRALFVGDTIFMPDFGTGRCDFPGGDAAQLYRSIRRLLALPAQTRLYVGHDYRPGGRPLQYTCTVADERARNIHVHDGVAEEPFVATRRAKDATLEVPNLILHALQVNMRAGVLPPPESNGVRYLKLPLNML